jgi:hypothetical protein
MNELGYQPLFCQLLMLQGYTLKYSLRNTTLEQGKDVVAISPNGIPCAFQLKGGDISLKRWRDEVRPEIEELIDCPIKHPGVDKRLRHASYLVTNGNIDDTVRVQIVDLNEHKWKETPLRVWNRGDLLDGFQGIAEGILPADVLAYKTLVELIFSDGTGTPDLNMVSVFLSSVLSVDKAQRSKEQRRRDISIAFLYSSMIAGPYRKVHNHVSVIRIMTLLLSLVFYLVDRYKIEDEYWMGTYRIIWDDIIKTSRLLEVEIEGGILSSSFTSPLDNEDLVAYRKHLAVSTMLSQKLSQLIDGSDEWASVQSGIEKIDKGSITTWGEASFIPMIYLYLLLSNADNPSDGASDFIKDPLLQIIALNGRRSKSQVGLLPPYYDIDQAVELQFDPASILPNLDYKGGSYMLKPLVEMLVRGNQRKFIEETWREISFIHFEEFIPEDPIDYYLWRVERGENRSIISNKTQSWGELRAKSESIMGEGLPETMKRLPAYLPFFLSMFPHRVNSETIGFLQSKISGRSNNVS